MKRLTMTMGMAAITAFLAVPVLASAGEVTGDVDNGRKIYQNGKGDNVPACQGCHGIDGLGSDDMGTPRLAYQVDTYILKQLADFAKGIRKDNTMFQMNDIAAGLTEQEMKDVAAYVHTLKTPFIGSDLDKLAKDDPSVGDPAKGKMIAEFGAPDHGVPACQSCHGFHGRSAGRLYPAIGGQRYTYLKHELEAFREGWRAYGSKSLSAADAESMDDAVRVNDYMGQMRAVAGRLTDEDIANVAAFLTVARPVAPGNPRSPVRQ